MALKRMRPILLMFTCMAFVFGSCRQKNTVSPENTHTYFYYPKLNVYYSHSNKQFHYTLDGGQTWQHKKGTMELANTLDEKVTIKSAQPEVWQENPEHRKQYNGVFSNFTIVPKADVSDSAGNTEQVQEEKKDKIEESDTEKQEEKRKKGFRRVRDKIKKLFKRDD